MRKWFPSEFTWRLYAVLQVAALILAAFVVLDGVATSNRSLFRYEPIYEEIDPAAVEAARARCAHLSDDPKDMLAPRDQERGLPRRPSERWRKLSPRDDCFVRESPRPRIVGQKYLGIDHNLAIKSGVSLLTLFALTLVVPFAVVRVPTWLMEGWRKDR